MPIDNSDGLNDWLQTLRAALASDFGISEYSMDALKVNFSQRYYDGHTVHQVLRMESGEPKLK